MITSTAFSHNPSALSQSVVGMPLPKQLRLLMLSIFASNPILRLTILTAALVLMPSNASALDKGAVIIGTQEAPNVLNIVPWQGDEFKDTHWELPTELTNSVLKTPQKVVDKDVLLREIEYFNLLNRVDANNSDASNTESANVDNTK